MKSIIHTLNVTSMTAHIPNYFFKRLKFGTLFSLQVHFSHQLKAALRPTPTAAADAPEAAMLAPPRRSRSAWLRSEVPAVAVATDKEQKREHG